MGDLNLTALWARAIVEELVRSGVRWAVLCPGSRSAPLALAFADAEGLQHVAAVDERCGAFVALGMAKATGEPVAVLGTSGTAAANFHPAVAEAAMAQVPLIAVTADRPWELQGFGAPQTMEQETLFGAHVRWACHLGAPEATDAALLHLRACVDRAVALARAPRPGPVQLNVPLRESLAPIAAGPALSGLRPRATGGRDGQPLTRFLPSRRAPSDQAVALLAERLSRSERGLIVCGPRATDDGFCAEVLALGESAGVPVVAEASSQLRFGRGGARVIAHPDAFLRDEGVRAELRPDWVLRFGGGLTTRALAAWVDAADDVAVVSEGAPVDPSHHASVIVEADPAALCAQLRAGLRGAGRSARWIERVFTAERAAAAALGDALDTSEVLSEALAARVVLQSVPDGGTLFVSSSMPIRALEAFGGTPATSVRVLANRGVNGIDGVVSSALGAAAATGTPTSVLVGDLAFLHDLNALSVAARNRISLTVVLLNNGGGGIFSHLPIAGLTPHFEALIATAHGLTFQPIAQLFGARYARPKDPRALRSALAGCAGLSLIEVVTDRAAEVALHRQLLDLGAAAARRALWPP